MGHERLDKLADLFWKGDCNEAEEQELRELVRTSPVPFEHTELKTYLEFTENAEAEDILGGSFDVQVMQEIERRENQKAGGGGYPTWLKIAAGIVIILGLFGVFKNMNDGPIEVESPAAMVTIEDTFDDPEMAYEEVKKALALVGMKMNDGMSHAGSLGMFDKAKEELCKDEGHRKSIKK